MLRAGSIRFACLAAIACALTLAACGGGDTTTTATTGASGASGATGAQGSTSTTGSSGSLTSDDQAAIEDTIKSWLLEGGCERMTDKFLEDQTFQSDPDQACQVFEDQFSAPSYGEDDIVISDVQGTPEKATAVVGDNISNVKSKYTLVKSGDQWQIDSADIS